MEHNGKRLEERVDRELRKLSERVAPVALMPRVMAVIRRLEARPWWQRPWLTWPAGYQVVSAVGVVAVLGACFLGAWVGWGDLRAALAMELAPVLSTFIFARDFLGTLSQAAATVLDTYGRIWLWLGFGAAIFVYLACVGLGTACFRLATFKRY